MSGSEEKLNVAMPDGHLMNHVLNFFEPTGVRFHGYSLKDLNRRPKMVVTGNKDRALFDQPEKVAVKVIRPQDMPTHVANGNFDLALSGVDWLTEHRLRFPTSPVDAQPYLYLGLGKVRIVAAMHQDWGSSLEDCMRFMRKQKTAPYIRIASEYIYLADNFALEKKLSPYRIIMTYGATESLIPEDADLIIENTETGNTLRKNNLTIIDTVMSSEACLIVNRESLGVPWKRELIQGLKSLFAYYLDASK